MQTVFRESGQQLIRDFGKVFYEEGIYKDAAFAQRYADYLVSPGEIGIDRYGFNDIYRYDYIIFFLLNGEVINLLE